MLEGRGKLVHIVSELDNRVSIVSEHFDHNIDQICGVLTMIKHSKKLRNVVVKLRSYTKSHGYG